MNTGSRPWIKHRLSKGRDGDPLAAFFAASLSRFGEGLTLDQALGAL
jgi:hypothetical protein